MRAGATGRIRHRTTWTGKLVLQLEIRHFISDPFDEFMPSQRGWQLYWRDAKLTDFVNGRVLQ